MKNPTVIILVMTEGNFFPWEELYGHILCCINSGTARLKQPNSKNLKKSGQKHSKWSGVDPASPRSPHEAVTTLLSRVCIFETSLLPVNLQCRFRDLSNPPIYLPGAVIREGTGHGGLAVKTQAVLCHTRPPPACTPPLEFFFLFPSSHNSSDRKFVGFFFSSSLRQSL